MHIRREGLAKCKYARSFNQCKSERSSQSDLRGWKGRGSDVDTNFCKVTAIIRCEVLENVERRLRELGVHGYSVMQVKGCGEYTDFYSTDCMTTHARVEIFMAAQRSELVAQAIMDTAYTGLEGDGIVAVLPVHKVYRIRKRAQMQPEDLYGNVG